MGPEHQFVQLTVHQSSNAAQNRPVYMSGVAPPIPGTMYIVHRPTARYRIFVKACISN